MESLLTKLVGNSPIGNALVDNVLVDDPHVYDTLVDISSIEQLLTVIELNHLWKLRGCL